MDRKELEDLFSYIKETMYNERGKNSWYIEHPSWLEDLKIEIEAYSFYDELEYLKFPELPKNVSIELVERFGGHEGAGERMHKIFKITKGDESEYVKFKGYYNSYDCNEWDDHFLIVEPKTVEVIQYFEKGE